MLLACAALVACQNQPRVETAHQTRRDLSEAQRYAEQGLFEAALAAFERVLDENPRQVQAHIGVGDVHEARGDYGQAAERYAIAKALDPGNYKATYKLGLMYHLLDRVRDAIREYLQAIAIRPESFDANLNLATAYLQINEPALGLPYAEQAVKLNPNSQTAHANLGAIYAAMGQYALAIDEYRAAAELGDLEPQIALNMAEALIRAGRYPQALNVLRILAAGQGRDNAEVYERTGYAHFKAGDYEKSLAAYEKALEIAPDDPAALNGKGVNLMTMYLKGKREDTSLRDRAIAAWQKSVQADPTQRRIVDLIARYRKL